MSKLDRQPAKDQSTQELLSTILRSRKNGEMLSSLPIASLRDATRRELGLTEPAYNRLMAGIELGRRIQETQTNYEVPARLTSSAKAIEFCRKHFSRLIADALQEEFHIVTLTTKNGVIDSHLITVGTLDASLVHPREVFRPAIKDSASSVILAHNHPSGDPQPSSEDVAVTRRLEKVGETIGIDVLDHIVMGKEGITSIREFHVL